MRNRLAAALLACAAVLPAPWRHGHRRGISRGTDRAAVERVFGRGSVRFATFEKRGSLVVGDVHPPVADVAGALTPVHGGVGPLTIAMLLSNTLQAACGGAS